MDFIDALKNEINKAYTENGDLAYSSTGSYCLDLFALIGSIRGNYQDDIPMFIRAFMENKILALKILLYARDIRSGLGERISFRRMYTFLGIYYPQDARKLIPYVVMYGRYDDLLCLIGTNCEDDVINLFKDTLNNDLKLINENKSVSLLSKWLPSINTSNKKTRDYAKVICKKLGYTYKEYRKVLALLRSNVIENNLRKKEYDFNYEFVPANAFNKYTKAFIRNDKARYEKFLKDVENGKSKVNSKTLAPYQIIHKYFSKEIKNLEDELFKKSIDTLWKSLDRTEYESNAIVVCDTSGSMYNNYYGKVLPVEVSVSLAILMSEQLKGSLKNKFITFSENPKLVEITKETIFDKIVQVLSYSEMANTNISRVYNLLLKTAISNHIPKENMIKKIIIVSDMEFDACVTGLSTYSYYKARFNNCGYDMPEVVFWNVCSRNQTVPVKQYEENTKLVSGSSNKIIDMVMHGKSKTPYDFMIESLSPYSFIDKLFE